MKKIYCKPESTVYDVTPQQIIATSEDIPFGVTDNFDVKRQLIEDAFESSLSDNFFEM